jgi:spore germination cell wall hydrolase CwlJ-like protein
MPTKGAWRLRWLVLPLVLSASAAGAPLDKMSSELPGQYPAAAPAAIDFSAPAIAEGERAKALNALIPASREMVDPARAFVLEWRDVESASHAVDCLTAAVHYEAATEQMDGQQAVAQVVLNRVRHPAYPNSVCGVVFQGSERQTGCQFTFTCDGSLRRRPSIAAWSRARMVARAALAGYVYSPVGFATHYHAEYVLPYWAPSLVKIGQIGAHIFYRWSGHWGKASAFRAAYAGNERYSQQIIAQPEAVAYARAAVTSVAVLPEVIIRPEPESPVGRLFVPEVQQHSIGLRPLRLAGPQTDAPAGPCYDPSAKPSCALAERTQLPVSSGEAR